jgi:hypothetical protein
MKQSDFLMVVISALVTGAAGSFAIALIVDFLTVTKV